MAHGPAAPAGTGDRRQTGSDVAPVPPDRDPRPHSGGLPVGRARGGGRGVDALGRGRGPGPAGRHRCLGPDGGRSRVRVRPDLDLGRAGGAGPRRAGGQPVAEHDTGGRHHPSVAGLQPRGSVAAPPGAARAPDSGPSGRRQIFISSVVGTWTRSMSRPRLWKFSIGRL